MNLSTSFSWEVLLFFLLLVVIMNSIQGSGEIALKTHQTNKDINAGSRYHQLLLHLMHVVLFATADQESGCITTL